MKSNRRKLFALYVVLCSAMAYSGLQLSQTVALADEAGTCCQVSSDCPGTNFAIYQVTKPTVASLLPVYLRAMVRTIASNRRF
jgi:hypothetical protein